MAITPQQVDWLIPRPLLDQNRNAELDQMRDNMWPTLIVGALIGGSVVHGIDCTSTVRGAADFITSRAWRCPFMPLPLQLRADFFYHANDLINYCNLYSRHDGQADWQALVPGRCVWVYDGNQRWISYDWVTI